MIHPFEDAPQICLLLIMTRVFWKSDGTRCMKKFYDWGQSPTNWSEGGMKSLEATYAYDSSFNDMLLGDSAIYQSFYFQLLV
eukprot:UN28567